MQVFRATTSNQKSHSCYSDVVTDHISYKNTYNFTYETTNSITNSHPSDVWPQLHLIRERSWGILSQ